ncbi:hypothetical protein HN011_004140 [Eciton burchellii]|nr:hypothetical protein HN011_004140 [Eciton burchellii]
MSGNLTRCLFLVTLLTITYRSAGKSSQLIVCSQPNVFKVQISGRGEYVVYGTKLLIRHSPQVAIFSYPGIAPVNVLFNESIIEFRGYTSFQPPTIKDVLPERLSWRANGIILGIGRFQKLSSGDYALRECRLFLPSNVKTSTNLPKIVEKAIVYYVQSCAKENLCQRIGTMTAEELRNINVYNELKHNMSHILHPINVTQKFELIMNIPVDIALKNTIHFIKKTGRSVIKLPDVKKTYNIGLGMKCHFEIVNGTFADLSTLKRTEDAFMSNVGKIHVIEFGLGLSTANFNFNYKLKLALIKVSGKILGSIDGLAMDARVIIYYDEICNIKLEYLTITQLGKINIKMTGLGPLSGLTSTILNWMTKMWRYKMFEVVEVNVKDIAEKQLNNYICNNYNEIIIP